MESPSVSFPKPKKINICVIPKSKKQNYKNLAALIDSFGVSNSTLSLINTKLKVCFAL